MIPAHDSPLAALAFDASGTKLATASEKVGVWLGWFYFFSSCLSKQIVKMCWDFPQLYRSHVCEVYSRCFKAAHVTSVCLCLIGSTSLFLTCNCFVSLPPGHSHPCLLHTRGTEALWVPTRGEEVRLRRSDLKPNFLSVPAVCARTMSMYLTCKYILAGVWTFVRWRSVWKVCTCRPPATQRRSTSSN